MRCAVRRLGSAGVEWAETPADSSWLAVPGPLGEEAAALVGAEPLLVCEDDSDLLSARPLREDELRGLPALLERGLTLARSLTAEWAKKVRGIRPSLAGGIVLELVTSSASEVTQLVRTLSERYDCPIAVVTLEPDLALHGSLGRIARDDGSVERALTRLLQGSRLRPGRYPRIGATVVTPRGVGIVQSVRTRDRTVLVRIGEESVRFGVDELGDPP